MARTEADREDLMAEAVALVRRVELALPGQDEPLVCGFRRDGSFSVYVGQDPVFHFDSRLRLRRAYRGGKLYRTQGDTLAELTRVRRPKAESGRRKAEGGQTHPALNSQLSTLNSSTTHQTSTTLVRRDLPPAMSAEFLGEMQATLQSLQAAVAEGRATVHRQVPVDDTGLLTDVGRMLARIVETEPALAPTIAGKR
jgi:hypothetical protein